MTKTAIVKGFARWYGKNVVPKLAAYSPEKIAISALLLVVESNPSRTEMLLRSHMPALGSLFPGFVKSFEKIKIILTFADSVDASQDRDEIFKMMLDGLRKAVAEEGGMKISKPGDEQNALMIRPSDIDLIAGEIRNAQQEIDNAAALAKANAPQSGEVKT